MNVKGVYLSGCFKISQMDIAVAKAIPIPWQKRRKAARLLRNAKTLQLAADHQHLSICYFQRFADAK